MGDLPCRACVHLPFHTGRRFNGRPRLAIGRLSCGGNNHTRKPISASFPQPERTGDLPHPLAGIGSRVVEGGAGPWLLPPRLDLCPEAVDGDQVGVQEVQVGHRGLERHGGGGGVVDPLLDGLALIGEAVSGHHGVLHQFASDGAEEDVGHAVAAGGHRLPGGAGYPPATGTPSSPSPTAGCSGAVDRGGQHGACLPRQRGEAGNHVELQVGAVPLAGLRAGEGHPQQVGSVADGPRASAGVEELGKSLRLFGGHFQGAPLLAGGEASHCCNHGLHLLHQPFCRGAPGEELQEEHAEAVHI
mmetsp:Transcript_8565/g.24585  ORF Transcript_8565/g.24585 Transcript_8565/m.24585 type:complete len:301 (+) Transcript_8565:278-1180(+)